MIIGVTEKESFLASDVPAILKFTHDVYYIGNLEVARLDPGSVTFYDLNGDEVEHQSVEITWDAEAAEKGGYAWHVGMQAQYIIEEMAGIPVRVEL